MTKSHRTLAAHLAATAAMIAGGILGLTQAAMAGVEPIAVPEPMTMGMVAAGAAGLYALKKLRNRR